MTSWLDWIILIIAIGVTAIVTRNLIPVLRRLAGQNIREEGPQAHQAKAGTPSMGGIAIIAGIIVAIIVGMILGACVGWPFDVDMWIVLASALLFGAIGFFDDWLKVVKKQNEGLTPKQKFGLQFVFSLVIALYMTLAPGHSTEVYIPFAGINVDFGIWYVPFLIFTLLAMVNAVNLTDGLDGLAAGTTAICALCFGIVATMASSFAADIGCAAITGACLGFLIYNRHPAQVFMGDTGSLALGGILTTAAVVMKVELLLPIVGIIYVLEVLSVCLQVGYFKATGGKRLFKMTPLHHHFELSGMEEQQVVVLFWGLTIVAGILGIVFGI